MTWTYTESDVDTVDKDWIRFVVGDTDTNDQLISDEEIAGALTRETRRDLAAARCAWAIAAYFARVGDEAARMRYEGIAESLGRYMQVHAGTWSYNGDPNNSSRDKVRFLIGDVDPANQLLNNAEIDEAIQDEPRPRFAAAICAEALAARFLTRGDGTIHERFLSLAARLRNQFTAVQSGSWSYDSSALSTSRNWVRCRIGDADTAYQQLNNDEIDGLLASAPRKELAAAMAADTLAVRWILRGELNRATTYLELGRRLRSEGKSTYP